MSPWRALVVAFLWSQAEATPFRVKIDVGNLDGGGDGSFVVEVHPEWAPRGAARFEELVKADFFKDVRFFRVIDGFMAQFGISGEPAKAAEWRDKNLKDDKVLKHNSKGMLTFATAGPNTRTTQIFINFGDNTFLDSQGFAPFAKVSEGMDVVDKLYKGYGEGAPSGRGPNQGTIQSRGNAYLTEQFPKLTYIKAATVLEGGPAIIKETFSNGEVNVGAPRSSVNLAGPLLVVAVVGVAALGVGFLVKRGLRNGDTHDDKAWGPDIECEELSGRAGRGRKRGQSPPE